MKFRNNVSAMQGYATAAQVPYEIGVMSNENNYGPSPSVIEALKAITPSDVARYPDPVATKMRDALSFYAAVPAENIVAFSGGEEAIHAVLGLFLQPGAKLAGHAPTFALYPLGAQFYDCQYDAVPLTQRFEFTEQQKDYLISRIDENTAAVALCNPNNPTGTLIPKKFVLEISDACRKFDIPLIVDEAYYEFCGETVAAQAVNEESNIIVIRTLSKAFALAGLRVGYAIAPLPVVQQLLKVKSVFNVNATAQIAAVAALGDLQYMKKSVAAITTGREKLLARLRETGFNAFDSKANFVLLECKKDFVQKLAEKGVLARGFALKGWGGESFCRITVGTTGENEKIIATIASLEA